MGITRLRLARFGCRNRPFYRIVAIDARRRRDAKPIEYVGTYDPLPAQLDGAKECRLRVDRIKYWLGVGAQPSERVSYLLWRAGLMPMPPIRYTPTKWITRKERPGAKKFHTMTGPAAAAAGAQAGLVAARQALAAVRPAGGFAGFGRGEGMFAAAAAAGRQLR